MIKHISNTKNNANAIRLIVGGEYTINWINSSGDLYLPILSGGTYVTTKYNGISNVVFGDGGQYNTVLLTSDKIVYSFYLRNTQVLTSYPVDNLGQPFRPTYVNGLYKNILAIQNGELYYWSAFNPNSADNEDILLQFPSPQTAPTKLTQPPNVYLKKVISGSFTSYGSATCAIALATDGTVWRWTRGSTTPTQVTYTNYLTDPAINIAMVASFAIVIETKSKKLYATGNANQFFLPYAGTSSTSAGWVDITSSWTNAGCKLPSKKIVTTYNTIHILDSKNDLYSAGSNVQGCIGNGYQTPSWRTYTSFGSPSSYIWGFANGEQMTLPTKINGKWSNIVGNNVVAFYLYGQDLLGNWYSWGRNKSRVLGNGITLNDADGAAISEYINIPAPRLVTPLTQNWTILPSQDINANRSPIANAGAYQVFPNGTTSATLYGDGTHQQQPTGDKVLVVTITTSNVWSFISGPNTPTIVSPNSSNTSVTNLISGEYTFRNTVTNSVGLTDFQDTKIIIR